MRYFPEYTLQGLRAVVHLSYPHGGTAILEDHTEIPLRETNRAWHGDTVTLEDGGVTGIVTTQRTSDVVVGYIQLDDKQKHGVNKKHMPIYLFHPISHRYPPMYVPSSAAKRYGSSGAVYILVRYKEWSPFDKYPHGQCEDILGPCGDPSTEACMRAHYHRLLPPLPKATLEPWSDPFLEERRDFREERVFSIDPPGCIDIDDAIHVRPLGEGRYEIGVHIADVTAFFPAGGSIDKTALQKACTVYLPSQQIPILPKPLAHDQASLHPGVDRPTFTCLLQVDISTPCPTILHRALVQGRIHSQAAFTYDEVDTRTVPSCFQNDMDLLYQLTQTTESHGLVETLMVWANETAAHALLRPDRPAILRSHPCSPVAHPPICEDPWVQHIVHASGPASYLVATSETPSSQTYHHTLQRTHYTHFTSPIRRYADQLVHRLLKDQLSHIPQETIEHLNTMQRRHRRFQRDQALLDFLYDPNTPECISCTGILLPFSPPVQGKTKLDIAIPSLRLVFPWRLVHPKASHLYHIDCDTSPLCLRIHDTTHQRTVELTPLQSIPVTLYKRPKEMRWSRKWILQTPYLPPLHMDTTEC